jgi:hypothetical protein
MRSLSREDRRDLSRKMNNSFLPQFFSLYRSRCFFSRRKSAKWRQRKKSGTNYLRTRGKTGSNNDPAEREARDAVFASCKK